MAMQSKYGVYNEKGEQIFYAFEGTFNDREESNEKTMIISHTT